MNETQRGWACAVGAYAIWGVIPLYFKQVEFASPQEVLFHRIVWCVALLLGIIALRGDWSRWLELFRDRRIMAWLLLSTAIITVNWFVYLWAVMNDQIVESSLGYYINPLLTAFLGLTVLREQLRPLQWAALGIAATGVVGTLVIYGSLPWVALVLSVSFGCYGLVRKHIAIESINGLAVETVLLLPLGLLGLAALGDVSLERAGQPTELLLLMFSAAVTAAPLLMFAAAAVRLPFSTLAFVQFAAPTVSLVIGVAVYNEPFGAQQWFTFSMIWAALALYCVDLVRSTASGRS